MKRQDHKVKGIHSRLFMGLCILMLLGCSEEEASAPRRAAPAPAAPKASAPALPTTASTTAAFAFKENTYSYDSVGKRDPFVKYRGELVEAVDLPKSPLERFALDQLSVKAIIWGIADPRALIRAPDNQDYIVRKDMRMGKNRGRISRITRREVFLEEEFRDPTGKLVVRETVMEIRPASEKIADRLQIQFEGEEP